MRSKLNRLEQKAAHSVSFACSEAQIGHKNVQWTRSMRNSDLALPRCLIASWFEELLWKPACTKDCQKSSGSFNEVRCQSIDQPADPPSSPVSVVPYNQPLTSDPLDPEGKRFLQQWNDESQQKPTWSECSNSYEIIWNYSDFIVNTMQDETPQKARHFDLVQLSGQGSRIHPAKGPNTSATSSTGSPNGCCWVQARYVSSGCSGSQKSLPDKEIHFVKQFLFWICLFHHVSFAGHYLQTEDPESPISLYQPLLQKARKFCLSV